MNKDKTRITTNSIDIHRQMSNNCYRQHINYSNYSKYHYLLCTKVSASGKIIFIEKLNLNVVSLAQKQNTAKMMYKILVKP